MVDRTQKILLRLSEAAGPLTSAQLAEAVGVSARTVRATMPQVSLQLAAHGAHLVSRRNVGYFIEIKDAKAFGAYREELAISSLRVSVASYDGQTRLLYIARKLVASSTGAKVDQLCDELGLSRSAIREPLRQAYKFCESFRLERDSAPGHGIRVRGEEHLVRLAMAELFELHFHKARLDETDREYAQWIDCDWQERQDIRHVYLKVQRESGWSLRDSQTQRVAMYLVIARNRIASGLDVTLPDAWIDDIRLTPFYDIADDVFSALADEVDSAYNVSDCERAFLAMVLLCNVDVDLSRNTSFAVPFLEESAQSLADAMIKALATRTSLDISAVGRARELLTQVMLPMLASKRYGMDGIYRFNYRNETAYGASPLCAFLGRVLAEAAAEFGGIRVSETDLPFYAAFSAWVFAGVEYVTHPLRVIVCDSMGREYARRTGEKLKGHFPQLVGSFLPCNLYEGRGLADDDYDVLLYNSGSREGYNYSFHLGLSSLVEQGMDFASVHDEVLLDAYDLRGLLPQIRHLRVIKDFRIGSPAEFFQLLALRHAPHEAQRWAMERRLETDDRVFKTGIHSSCVFVFDTAEEGDSSLLELYRLRRPMLWNDNKVNRLLYVRLRFDGDPRRAKAHERVLALLGKHPTALDWLERDPQGCLQELLTDSLRINSKLESAEYGAETE